MDNLKKNIFLTGAPSSGKTTVIKKVIARLRYPATGFYTEEERVAGKWVGFIMKTIEGNSGYLAHQNIQSDFHIRRYGVSIENIETIAVPSITPRNRHIIILDEIGKMECFSVVFIQAALTALDSPSIVIGTITIGDYDFITRIKSRDDIEIHEGNTGEQGFTALFDSGAHRAAPQAVVPSLSKGGRSCFVIFLLSHIFSTPLLLPIILDDPERP